MSRILVTGASGQLGSALVRRLVAENYPVRVILRQHAFHPFLPMEKIERVDGSFYDPDLLEEALAGITTVFHVAGVVSYSARRHSEVYRVNVNGTIRIFEAAVRAGVSEFILTSSTMAVGVSPNSPPVGEEVSFPPNLYHIPYADSKRLSERYVLAGAHRAQRVVALCPSTIIGAGERLGNFRRLFQLAHRGLLLAAPPGMTGVVDVEDAVEGHLLAWRKGVSGKRYILNAENISFRSLFGTINRAARRRIRPVVVPRGVVSGLYASLNFAAGVGFPIYSAVQGLYLASAHRHFLARRAHQELGWTPSVGLEESLRQAAVFFAENNEDLNCAVGTVQNSRRSPSFPEKGSIKE